MLEALASSVFLTFISMCTELGIKFSVLYPDSTEVNNKIPTQCNPVLSGTGLVPLVFTGAEAFSLLLLYLHINIAALLRA